MARLKCPYCSAEQDIPQSAEQIHERPIEEALSARHDLGWGTERKTFSCQRCGARTTFEPGQAAGNCAFCGTSAVTEAPPDANMIRPEGLLPFATDRNMAVEKFRSWMGGLWFRPSDLKEKSSVTTLRGVYVPFWTFDAATHSAWSAEAGYYYYVDVQVMENGRPTVKKERRIRWQPTAGFLEKFFDDLPIAASRGLDRSLSQSIEPFPTEKLIPYEASYLSGFLAEEYAVGAEEALGHAKERMKDEIHAACANEVPGDTHRNLSVRTQYSGVSFKNALLPVWIAAYEYAGKPYRFLVNGVTGKVAGHAPYSWVKIILFILAILGLILVFSSLKGESHSRARSLSALPTTLTEERAMAPPAIMGLSVTPKMGYRIPAATGIRTTL